MTTLAQGRSHRPVHQRDPAEGSRRASAPNPLLCTMPHLCRIHAFDREPERIVSLLTRRDGASESTGSRSRSTRSGSPERVRLRGQCAVSSRHLSLQRHGEDESWDACGKPPLARGGRWCVGTGSLQPLRFAVAEDGPGRPARADHRRKKRSTCGSRSQGLRPRVSEYGSCGITGIEPPHRIELLPYTVPGAIYHPPPRAIPQQRPRSWAGSDSISSTASRAM